MAGYSDAQALKNWENAYPRIVQMIKTDGDFVV
jgi:hypothetical protein